MTQTILIFGVIWAGAMVAYYLVTRAFRNADVGKMKERILDSPAKEKKQKAGPTQQALLTAEDQQTGRLVTRILKKFEVLKRLETLLEQAGLRWRPVRVVHSCLALFLTGFMVARIFIPVPYVAFQLVFGALTALLPVAYIARVRSKRLFKFEEMFPESLEFVARSMRAGHAFSVSLEMLHREFQEPLAGEFRRTFDEHNLGLPLESALLKLAARVPLLDVHFFVSAVLLQKRTGGNLAEILDKLAYVIRERFKLRGKIRAISAHGKMTGTALTLIPVGVAVLMFYVNPGYVGFFIDDETGHYMMGGAITLQLIGYAVIRKIVAIEV